jgi:hypothetical protein
MMNGYAPYLGQVAFAANPVYFLGQPVTDPVILAKVDLAESYANALKAVAKVVGVTPEVMSQTTVGAKETFKSFLKNRTFVEYAMKLLVLSAVIVKENIRALGMTPQQLANILSGGDAAVREIFKEDEVKAELDKNKEEIIARAPENIRTEVRRLIESSGIKPENLAPNLPPEATPEEVHVQASQPVEPGLSGLQIAALVGIPLVVLTAVGLIARR